MNTPTLPTGTVADLENHPIVAQEEWIAARKELLKKEKAFTRQRDALAADRRGLPWIKIEKQYTFVTPGGRKTLAELFDGQRQLIVYHFMLGPGWEEGCPGCSFLADHIDGANFHLPHAGVKLVVVSRAPLPEIEIYKKRMGWRFPWVSSFESGFNYDFHVSFTPEDLAKGKVTYNYALSEGNDELPGASVFYKNDAGEVFHTYSTYARGGESLIGAFNYLDLVPVGRNENDPDSVMGWVRRHDQYPASESTASAEHPGSCCGSEKAPA
jgi:predicted dithiol-disulfide oxidoreductase (DUF899 family)